VSSNADSSIPAEQGGEHRPRDRPERAPDPDHREQALAVGVVIDVGGEAPELGDGDDVEDPDPQEEGQADRLAADSERPEQTEVGDEEQRDDADEQRPPHPGRQPTVGARHADQQDRLAGRRVALHLGPAGHEDERLAGDLQEVVGREQQEHVRRQQDDRGDLVAAHVAEQTEQELAATTGRLHASPAEANQRPHLRQRRTEPRGDSGSTLTQPSLRWD
jgi:hypothetical protein